MAELSLIRQKVQAARQAYARGDLYKARALLKGLEHPKAQSLLAEIENQIAQSKPKQKQFPFIPVLVFFALTSLLLFGGFFIFQTVNSKPSESLILPTLIPTSDCSFETVQLWWREQNLALDSFVADASSASRTMPGERLNERLQELQAVQLNFPLVPACANLEVQARVSELTTAMEELIQVLEQWANREIDGTELSQAFYLAETSFRTARQNLSHELGD